jgi:hypothetical protein
MAASAAQITDVRENLGETIPEGETAAATLFTDEQITSWIDQGKGLPYATLLGWRKKMAHYANLVNVTDGAASRTFSDLFDHAAAMVKFWSDQVVNPATKGRTRVGKIVRS